MLRVQAALPHAEHERHSKSEATPSAEWAGTSQATADAERSICRVGASASTGLTNGETTARKAAAREAATSSARACTRANAGTRADSCPGANAGACTRANAGARARDCTRAYAPESAVRLAEWPTVAASVCCSALGNYYGVRASRRANYGAVIAVVASTPEHAKAGDDDRELY
jgi:hypothetical protein